MFIQRLIAILSASATIVVSAQTTLGEFFVYAPAKTDSGMLARQQAAAPAHLVHAQALDAAGKIGSGGPVLTPSSTATNKTFAGSAFILKVENITAARRIVHEDPYFINRVWDAKDIVVLPYITYF